MRRLKEALHIPLAMEMAATDKMVQIALGILPARVCLVPEKRQELTTEGGLDVLNRRSALKRMIQKLSAKKISISLFIDPTLDHVRSAHALGADTVELHTGRYARAKGAQRKGELGRLRKASQLAGKLKLTLHAGHGLDLRNVLPIAQLPGMVELNIGFSIVSRAVFIGLGASVKEMKEQIN